MTKSESINLQNDFENNQKEINKIQLMLRKNKNLFSDPKFMEKRLKLFYKSYCIDCTIRGEWVVNFKQYAAGI